MVAALPPQKEGYGVMLSNDQIETWRDEGAVVMQLPADIYEPALEWLNDNCTLDHCDDSEFAFDTPDRKFEFPTFVDELDDFILHEQFIAAVGQLLGTFDIRLALAHFWPKIGAAAGTQAQDSSDQRMHMDYGNNTILHPDWHQPDAVTAIVYFDDSDEVAGGTGFVTRTGESDPVYQPPFVHMPGQAGKPFINDRASAEQWFKENDPDAYKLRHCTSVKRWLRSNRALCCFIAMTCGTGARPWFRASFGACRVSCGYEPMPGVAAPGTKAGHGSAISAKSKRSSVARNRCSDPCSTSRCRRMTIGRRPDWTMSKLGSRPSVSMPHRTARSCRDPTRDSPATLPFSRGHESISLVGFF